jgi:hypothetical protein
MTGGPGAKDAPHPFTDEEPARGHDLFGMGERERQAVLDWVGENLTQVRRSVYEQRLLHWSLGIGFVVGLAAHWCTLLTEEAARMLGSSRCPADHRHGRLPCEGQHEYREVRRPGTP